MIRASGSPEVKPLSSTQYFVNAKVRGPNLIVNGDFSQGNTGFLSNYTLSTSGNQEGTYTVAGNPASWDPGFSNCTDHTGGNGNMLLVNGSKIQLKCDLVGNNTGASQYGLSFFCLVSADQQLEQRRNQDVY